MNKGAIAAAVISVLAVWSLGATAMLAQAQQENAELRVESDAKIKALTRRLVGVASHQALEQETACKALANRPRP